MHVESTRTFLQLYKKLPTDIQERTDKALELIEANPAHPSLHNKKMSGYNDIFEARVSDNYRLTYKKIGSTAYLRKIGTHDLLRNP